MLAIDLFCGLGGWTDGLLAEGYGVVGFDIERHRYPLVIHTDSDVKGYGGTWFHNAETGRGNPRDRKVRGETVVGKWQEYPAQLVLQDVLTLHGSQFRNATLIVASPPCQAYSYMAMPWKLAKAKAAAIRADATGKMLADLNALFNACFRIQREACEAAGRYIPMVVENVKGAQPWVGPAKANFGSFYLWGDVAMVGKRVVCGREFGRYTRPMRVHKNGNIGGGSWFAIGSPGQTNVGKNPDGRKVSGFNFHEFEKTGKPGGSFQPAAVEEGRKGFVTGLGKGHDWRQDPSARFNSKSSARKAASAQIAKIPLELSRYVARCYRSRGAITPVIGGGFE